MLRNYIIILALFFVQCSPESKETDQKMSESYFFVGSYTENPDQGIYIASINDQTGELKLSGVAASSSNPSFIAHKNDKLFAVNELGGQTGTITSYGIDRRTLRLFPIDTISSQGIAPCFISLDKTGYAGYVANYGPGNVLKFEVDNSGRFLDSVLTAQHFGKGPNNARQEGPHAHSITLDPSGKMVLAADLGTDQIMMYNSKTLAKTDSITMDPGAGPRHFTFNADGNLLYVMNELNSTVSVIDAASQSIIQSITTLPADYDGNNSTADIHFHPSGKYLYGSNRGHNSIVRYEVDDDGKLMNPAWIQDGIDWPRNFAVSSDGNWLLVANQFGNSITSYRLDEKGKANEVKSKIEVHAPVCIKFYP